MKIRYLRCPCWLSSVTLRALCASALLSGVSGWGATFIWIGGGTTGNFSDTNNWNPNTFANINANVIQFDALVSPFQANATNDVSGNPNSFVFNSGCNASMTINGSVLQFAPNAASPIVNNSTYLQTFNCTAKAYWTGTAVNRNWTAASGDLAFNTVSLNLSGYTGSAANLLTLTLNGAHDGAINGALTMGGGFVGTYAATTVGLVKSGAGTWTLGGANNYNGATTITAGKLSISSDGNLGAVPATATANNLVINGGTLSASAGFTLNSKRGVGLGTSGGTIEVAAGQTLIYAGIAANNGGAGALIKTGNGILTLSGLNTYTGDTTVSTGKLTVSSKQNGGGNLIVNDGANLTVQRDATTTALVAASLTLGSVNGATNGFVLPLGNPAAEVITAGTLTLNGTSAIEIAGGAFTVGQFPLIKYTTLAGSGTISETPVSLPAGITATVSNNVANSSIDLVISAIPAAGQNLTWMGYANGQWNTLVANWTNAVLSAAVGFGDGDFVTLDDSATGTTVLNVTVPVQPGSVTVSNTIYGYTINGVGSLDGTNGLTKTGTNSLTINVPTTYSGGTVVSNGILRAIGLGSGSVTVMNGAALGAGINNTVATLSLSNDLSLTSSVLLFDLVNTANADLITVAGNVSASGVTTISLSTTNPLPNGDYTLLQVAGTLGGTAANFNVASVAPKAYSIIYSGNNVVLHVTNTTPIIAKSWVGDGGANQWDINTSVNWVETGGFAPYAYNDGDAVTFDNNAKSNLTVNVASVVMPSSVTINSGSNYVFFGAGNISGPTALNKSGTGRLILTTANSYTGGTTIFAGGLMLSNTIGQSLFGNVTNYGGNLLLGAAEQIADTTILNFGPNSTGRLDLQGYNETIGGVQDVGGTGNRILEAALDNTPGAPATLTLNVANGATYDFGGLIRNASGASSGSILSVVKSGAGTQIFSGSDASGVTFSGGLLVSGGTMLLSNCTAKNSLITNNAALVFDISGTLTRSLEITGTGGLTKLGAGKLTLAAANTYTGNTTVNGGILVIQQPTLAAGSTIAVSNGVLQLDFAGAETNTVAALILNGVTQPGGIYSSNTSPAYLAGAGSLLVASSVASNPTNISYTISGNQLTLTWPADHLGWYAQSNSVNLADTNYWFDVPNSQLATNVVITISPEQPKVFYRLRN